MTIFKNPRIRGRLFENFGLGFFVNGMYGMSDGSFEIFNLIDIIVGTIMIIEGIKLQEEVE